MNAEMIDTPPDATINELRRQRDFFRDALAASHQKEWEGIDVENIKPDPDSGMWFQQILASLQHANA